MSLRSIELTFNDELESLVARALRFDVSSEVAEQARSSTRRAIGLDPSTRMTAAVRRRAQAYFSAVVQRAAVRGSAGPRATARLIADAVVADMRETGRDGQTIWRELERGWGRRLPCDVLEEYRLQLCG